MLLAERTGRSLRLGRVLSSRRSRRRLLRRSCCCNLVVTRNPFLLVVMVARYNIKHRRIHKGFRVFQKTFAPTSVGFACSRTNSIGMIFVWIPAGNFIMGSPKEETGREPYHGDDETLHKVTLTRGFYMGVYAVTQEEWQAVVGDNPSRCKGEKN